MGVPNLYKQFLLHCKDEIRQALYTFTIPSNYPIHIHCTQGKDRTGLVSALVCGIAGVPTEIIVKDYAMSQPGLAPIYSDVVKHVVDAGLSKDFANALPETMRDVLHFIDEEFGSIEKYLVSIGFRKEDQERIREIICA
ncbi:protein-tyrosine phosphatase-like protein [Radiomyces spectabilis]|uniref:protein-tyrosine phosphatase-like protein n=1 Tax=Radiomyces spectabilis TaxID=64574 RepID=UPI00221F3EFD|nr:protein-tyrosine phosphatase-like protein [Radiomyces spectabilis]KAI8391232.1 protein-tyrosine phosphatase-like protein [Radiomyces spectabilis]